MYRSDENYVSIKLIGVYEVATMLMEVQKKILTQVDKDLIMATTKMAYEVQQSIMGLRNEKKSVDTGNFANSIGTTVSNNEGIVYSDVEYAPYLEYGTYKMEPRYHFNNTAFRMEKVIKKMFEDGVSTVVNIAS